MDPSAPPPDDDLGAGPPPPMAPMGSGGYGGSLAYAPHGYPPREGYPPQQGAYPLQQGGFPQGYPPQGYPPQGYPPQGYPPQGYGAQPTVNAHGYAVDPAGPSGGSPNVQYSDVAGSGVMSSTELQEVEAIEGKKKQKGVEKAKKKNAGQDAELLAKMGKPGHFELAGITCGLCVGGVDEDWEAGQQRFDVEFEGPDEDADFSNPRCSATSTDEGCDVFAGVVHVKCEPPREFLCSCGKTHFFRCLPNLEHLECGHVPRRVPGGICRCGMCCKAFAGHDWARWICGPPMWTPLQPGFHGENPICDPCQFCCFAVIGFIPAFIQGGLRTIMEVSGPLFMDYGVEPGDFKRRRRRTRESDTVFDHRSRNWSKKFRVDG